MLPMKETLLIIVCSILIVYFLIDLIVFIKTVNDINKKLFKEDNEHREVEPAEPFEEFNITDKEQ